MARNPNTSKNISSITNKDDIELRNQNNNEGTKIKTESKIRKTDRKELGKSYYEQAMTHLQVHENNQIKQEEMNRREQYESLNNGDNEDNNKKSRGNRNIRPGVKVVKTIVKQANESRKHHVTRGNNKRNKINNHENLYSDGNRTSSSLRNTVHMNELEKAAEKLQKSAFLFGYTDAIVSLANHVLSNSSNDEFDVQNELFKYIEKEQLEIGDSHHQEIIHSIMNEVSAPIRTAEKLYKLAARSDSKEAWFNLGNLYWTGHNHCESNEIIIKQNKNLALSCFENAIKLGDHDAKYFLAVHYLGQDAPLDIDVEGHRINEHQKMDEIRIRGLELVQDAADSGHIGALFYLALLHRNGDDGLNIIPCLNLFSEYLNAAADGGNPDALFLRAHCQYNGDDGFVINHVKSLDDFIDAGNAGNADGYVSAGAMLNRGFFNYEIGAMQQDKRKAFELYQEAGEMGSPDGWKNVAACYMLGEGVPRCEKTAKYIVKVMLKNE